MRVIANPLAGRGYGARSLPTVQRLLAGHGLAFDLVTTRYAGHAIELARQAVLDGYQTIVAVGGDGTYQEVINGMLSASAGHAAASDAVVGDAVVGDLGLIPVGSGCDFAWSVRVPADLEGACALLARGQTRIVDLGRVTVDPPPRGADGMPQGASRYFDNTVGVGFDGIVTAECQKLKFLRGLALYLPTVLKTVFLSFRPMRSTIDYELDGSTTRRPLALEKPGHLEKTVLMATVCNGQREGGGFCIAPEARNDDGMLDVCIADNVPRLQILAMIPHFLKGTHVDKPTVTMLRSRRIAIASPDPLIAHADGEMLCTAGHRIECEAVPNKLRVIC